MQNAIGGRLANVHLQVCAGILLLLWSSSGPSWTSYASPIVGGSTATTTAARHVSRSTSSRSSKDLTTLVITNEATYRNRTPLETQDRKVSRVDISHLFREDSEDYPEEEIRQLLRETPSEIKDLFNVINTKLDPHMNLTERVAFYTDDLEEIVVREESVCRSVTRNIYPREARRANSLVYIPNNQEFMQVIQADICQHPDKDCSYLVDSLPYGMTSVCHQKYAYKKLLFKDPFEKRMASDLFRYPSCCACYIRTLPIDSRSANNSTSTSSSTQVV